MKRYIIYKELKSEVTGNNYPVFLKENGEFSYDPKDAKTYNVRNWIELILKFINILIIIFGKDLKYKELDKPFKAK